jgi:hypothetical protein
MDRTYANTRAKQGKNINFSLENRCISRPASRGRQNDTGDNPLGVFRQTQAFHGFHRALGKIVTESGPLTRRVFYICRARAHIFSGHADNAGQESARGQFQNGGLSGE